MIEDRLREIREELTAFDDEFLRYSFLAELSAYVPADQPDLMTEDHLYHGCQSRVWLRFRTEGDVFFLDAVSDTLILRGVLYVMMQLFNGLPLSEIAERKIDFLNECGLAEHFGSERTSGIRGILDRIYQYCCNAAQNYENT